ncbi:type 1 fimbrial protein [Pantoea sp. C2G6]|uniref:type 1 fimbrial protein n=1 Tax=Pantoea sp. C2G6 TaxID=3243084 RepID=UPI003EDA98B8
MMRNICLVLLALLAGPVSASSSGQITFRGAVTNGSCDMNVVQNPVIFNCYNPASGKMVSTTADLLKQESLEGLPIEVKVSWINPEKTKGLIFVNYL